MTNYQAIGTCACIGENLAVALPEIDGLVRLPFLSTADVQLHLGGNASWEQRRAFEWGLIGMVARRNGDVVTSEYCAGRVALLKAVAS